MTCTRRGLLTGGASYNLAEARCRLEALGLTVTQVTAVAHAPRAPAIWLVALAERLGWGPLVSLVARILDRFEVLERWPTRYRTGYYLAILAEKRGGLPATLRSGIHRMTP